ncbi:MULTISPECIES: LpxL/LpxP family Kdo(2)-lipid IV(A) lauroyl/palmitoleoyl acyltransferase [Pseudoalteromonas]|uniref:Lipid A biosynthesis acyltransferase n=1 Tax=Pseudoalteromonas carrageenovora IAM 12662 TaxID=1314868 RepID=A0A2K4XCH1_PSEVC|nr:MULTISPECIES: LpxL/LpxP family Kdo(2)-lipid IV(A) lauroyl/palmitoleoyl acyltransferase [Pseudoalteromonas]KTF11268.1 lipid A biosynthesis lauroyl acyltransferase [Pseudoalteromonas sp. H103]MBE0380885.1 lipid A biosynthesis lauroyl acyltransferase [Pseudoalteromonas carrageenovora IAM 12662]MCQ8889483.1 LpxL/LpxP family Kdo(2)-lipid IV(A) lauroyl/palmitoleoyl acyltransferase [Pseudoalteromonas carrageenovora]MDO6465607.1 LpxL/LpxP family Kdo(2)-lipid IV(A) lauroyl/palmitoleoyl acyltransferas
MVTSSPFKISFLGPRYWLTWIGVLFLYVISWLPQKLQLGLGKLLGRLVHKFMKRRRHIAEVNIKLCFPDMSEAEQKKLVLKNMENTGIAMVETGMAWWWPQWRVKNVYGSIKGLEHFERVQASGKGVLLLVPHFLHLEMTSRVMGLKCQGLGFYRPHNNPLMEYFTTNGRLRSNEYLIGRKDVKGLLKSLKNKKVCYYLPDQDYGRNRCEFVPFYAVPDTATTTGTLMFAGSKNCETMSLISHRDDNGKYHLEIIPELENFPSGDDKADVTRVNQRVEQAINTAPAQYMWLHRRFKTRPDKNTPSFYKK